MDGYSQLEGFSEGVLGRGAFQKLLSLRMRCWRVRPPRRVPNSGFRKMVSRTVSPRFCFFFFFNETEENGEKKTKNAEPEKSSQPETKKWKWIKTEETEKHGRQRKTIGSGTVPATPFRLINCHESK